MLCCYYSNRTNSWLVYRDLVGVENLPGLEGKRGFAMSESDILYDKLARHLDKLPGGFPHTESGVEMRVLRRLFSPDEAELALKLTLIPEEPRVIARRAGITAEEAGQRLEAMAQKGLVYSSYVPGQPPRYMAIQYVVGIWEFQVQRMDEEFIHINEEFLPHFLEPEIWSKAPQLRTIPVGESIPVQAEVMPYEIAEELVLAQDRITVAPCICRKERGMVGDGCDKPLETCLSFGGAADFYQRYGLGRLIHREEALSILKQANDAGLVLQPANSQHASFICCCCGDCCGVLRNIKRHPKPASILSSAFFVEADADTCTSCGLCEMRCQMEAIAVENGESVVDRGRCIGCGLCVTTCPTGSLRLVRKPEAELPYVPKNFTENAIRLGRERGAFDTSDLVMMQVRSKVDRLLATL